MAYEKRICVLKQIKKGFSADGASLSGAVYAERLGSELTVTPRILGIAPVREGRYALVVAAEEKTAVLELKGAEAVTVSDFPSIKAGIAVLLAFIRGDAEPIAFGSCGIAPASYEPLLAALTEHGKKSKREEVAEDLPPFREQATAKYDDEAIARSDYYRRPPNADDDADRAGVEGAENAQDGAYFEQNEDDAIAMPRGTLTYYNTVRERLDEAFRKFPQDDRLRSVFPFSEWVRAEGGALLGVIYEGGIPKYLCVAAEGENPPAGMEGKACFVPFSHFTETEGMWVVFQSADSGEYVTVKDC